MFLEYFYDTNLLTQTNLGKCSQRTADSQYLNPLPPARSYDQVKYFIFYERSFAFDHKNVCLKHQ